MLCVPPLLCLSPLLSALLFSRVFQERTKNAQFIIISLRNNMFELADRLIGIYKTYDCTKTVTVNPGKISLPPLQSIELNTAGGGVPGR